MISKAPLLVSFRDPVARVVRTRGRIFRAVRASHRAEFEALLAAPWFARLESEGRVPRTTWVDPPTDLANQCAFRDGDWVWMEHEAIEFPLYPHEITAQHLYDAALLTLDIAELALEQGLMLKDASAWNVLFQRGTPVFCDVSSFVPYDGNPLWLAYGQFGRHFVIPLLLHKYRGLTPSRLFTTSRDGIAPAEARRLLGPLRSLFDRAALEFVFLPSLVEERRGLGAGRSAAPAQTTPAVPSGPEDGPSSTQMFEATLSRLRRHIHRLNPRRIVARTRWSDYQDTRRHYSADDIEQKRRFVSESLAVGSGAVLDLGCNRGEYAVASAALGRPTVATDFDDGALRRLYDTPEGRAVSVACLNLAAPTPAVGWCNEEVPSFLDRARNHFQTVMCLGLLHHLLVTERVPLAGVMAFFEALGPRTLIVEWIGPGDPMFIEIAGPNLPLYEWLSETHFESALAEKWRIHRKEPLGDVGRILYELRRVDALEGSRPA